MRPRVVPAQQCPRCVICPDCRYAKKYGLTLQELRVVRLIGNMAASNKDIARDLNISEETVKRHISNIFDKMGTGSRLQLGLLAVKCGLLETDGEQTPTKV